MPDTATLRDMTEEILEKIAVGDGLSDEELEIAIRFYSRLEADLKLLGAEYRLAWRPVMFRLRELEGYKASRERNDRIR